MMKVVCQACGGVLDYSDEFVQVRYGVVSGRGQVGYYHAKPVDYFHLNCDVAIRRPPK